jgi:biotin-(acetyl-CoA carboxylase) ligase
LNVRIKWPNDIFIGHDFAKLGGILATSSISNNDASIKLGSLNKSHRSIYRRDLLFLGIGINISNAYPSICLNDAINEQKTILPLKIFTVEEFIGRTVSYLYLWISRLSQSNVREATMAMNEFYQLYQSLWLHQ